MRSWECALRNEVDAGFFDMRKALFHSALRIPHSAFHPMIHILDTKHLGRPGIIAATALETDDGIALFDTGAAATFDNISGRDARRGFRA